MNEKCFALRKDGECRALECRLCMTSYADCPFYKSTTQAKQDKAARFERLARLPQEQQERISARHYEGRMPWRKEAAE